MHGIHRKKGIALDTYTVNSRHSTGHFYVAQARQA
jgi:hypothetical protein